MLDLTIVIPAKNEERFIEAAITQAVEAARKINIKYEIVVVNDGSHDKTGDIVSKLKIENLILIENEESQGIGGAFFQGVEKASGKYVVLVPGDNENDTASVLQNFIFTKDYELIIPYVINPEVRNFKRQILSYLFTKIINISFNKKLKYYNGTCIYKTSLLKNMVVRSRGFFFGAEIILRILKSNITYIEVPTKLHFSPDKKSNATTIKSFIQIFKDYINLLRWNFMEKGE